MITSDSTAAIATALAAAQVEMVNPVKDRTARVKSDKADYTYQYADLAAVLDAVRPPLARNGIAIVQSPAVADGMLTITTRLLHSSGEFIESKLSDAVDGSAKIQTLGSAITFLRRYALQAICGVNAEQDSDGGGDRHEQPRDEQRREPQREPTTAKPAPAKAAAAKVAPATAPTPAKPDTEMTDLYARLGKLIGKPVAAKLWRHWGTTDQDAERLDVLRRCVAAVDAINRRLDKVTAERLVNDITIDRNDPDDVPGIVADLVAAAEGKPSAPAAPAVAAGKDGPPY